jgi:hypothetical protein
MGDSCCRVRKDPAYGLGAAAGIADRNGYFIGEKSVGFM